MDFKPFSEVVLPPEKGTGINPKSRRREKKGPGAPKVREYQLGPDAILVLDESLARGPEVPAPATVVTGGVQGLGSGGDGPVLTAEDIRSSEERLFSVPQRPASVTLKSGIAEPAAHAAPPVPSPRTVTVERPQAPRPAAEKPAAARPAAPRPAASATSGASSSSASSSGSRKKTNPNLNRDFIIAYNRSFIGCFRASRRITNRTAFLQVAQTVQGKIEDFDISKLELYKAVPLKIKKPKSLAEVTKGSVNWFPEKESKKGEE